MDLVILAATQSDGPDPAKALMFLVAAWLVWQVISCVIWPYTPCSRCGGNPKTWSGDGQNYRLCRKCGASGRRRRLGARVLGRGSADG